MRPLILMPTINSRHWNACYLQLLSVQRCQHPPQAERSCWGGGPDPPSSRALLLGGGPDPPSSRAHGPSSPPPLRRRPATLHPGVPRTARLAVGGPAGETTAFGVDHKFSPKCQEAVSYTHLTLPTSIQV